MTRTEGISLDDLHVSDVAAPESRDTDQYASNPPQDDSRQWESNRKRYGVLVGNVFLQLPIWGFAMNYGIFQEYFSSNWTLTGSRDITGIIGTTSNGVTYLSMPFLFALFARQWAHRRQIAALCGAMLMCVSFLLSAYSTHGWTLVVTQGVMSAFGCALIYSPTTLTLGDWFNNSNRALAYGIVLSSKNIIGSAGPFMFRALLDRYGFHTTMIVWAIITAATSVIAIFLIHTHPSSIALSNQRARKIPWHFLKHQTFYIYAFAIILQGCGYGIPQTYLNTYAHEVTLMSQATATLLLTLFNGPGIVASSFFGYLIDNKRFPLSAATITAISAVSSALSAFLFWGMTSPGSIALIVLFAITFGFFASGYSATWGAVLKELEQEAAQENEAIDTGMVYGLLNGARGIGYVSGGLAGVQLIKAGSTHSIGNFGYGTTYGPLIIFTGISSAFGGFGLFWKWKKVLLHSIDT